MKRIFFLLLCLCFSVLSFAQRTNETKQLTKQDSLRLQQLLSGQVEIVIDDETQKEIDRLFNPEKWKMKSTPFPKKNMKFETELPRYYISQMDTIDGRGYIRLLPYGPFETPEEEQIYVEIPINKELLAGYDPRLELAGADCENISVIDESIKSLSMIDERLEEAMIRTKAKMLILDPIQAYLGGGMDMNRANEARDMTKKLAALAEKYQCAIVLVGHMNKATGNKAAYRGMGSIDFFAVARSVLLVGRVEGEANIRAVIQIKNNLAAFGHPKAFELSEGGFQWL